MYCDSSTEIIPVIAIDGPSASGKGTIASMVAAELGWAYLDSGALYRLTALYAEQRKINWENETAIAALAAALPVEFIQKAIYLNGEEVSQSIRTEHIGMGASAIAKFPQVRHALLSRQRQFLVSPGLVADGRDMGSVVFPHAQLKIFLTASSKIRAIRRARQLHISESDSEFERILKDICKRDDADRNRTVAPLQPLEDAYILDTSELTISESVQKVLDWYQKT